jgi:hypothetical protein
VGEGLFTGLRRMKNEKDYVKFGPRFLIDIKRLKSKGVFSLAYPKSGQKPNIIRNAVLTPALKEVVLAYLAGEPQDTTELEPKELEWLKFVWKNTGLQKEKPKMRILPKIYVGKREMKARMKVLLGEFGAGNDNPALLDELSKLTDKLEANNWLTKDEIFNCRRFVSGE